ncbi:MAG: hypothetical protein AAF790_10365 [Planctomycetota bacterium]
MPALPTTPRPLRLSRLTPPWRRGWRVAALVAALWALAGVACAQRGPDLQPPAETLPRPAAPPAASRPAAPSLPLAEVLTRRGDLTLRNNSLNAALLTISELWGVNIVSGDVPGSVNGVFKDAPLREILDSILISNGYGYRAVGESLVVSDLGKLGQVNPFFESATIAITAAQIDEVVAGAQLFSTPQGQVRAIPSASTIFVLDFPDRVRMIREFALSVDDAARRASGQAPIGQGPEQLQVAYLKTHFINAENAATMLETVLSPAGRVASMAEEDRLVVVDFAANLQMAQAVLQRIDQPRPQVAVRALIYDISLQDMEEIGLNWQSLAGGNGTASFEDGGLSVGSITSGGGALVNSVTKAPFGDTATGGSFTFFTLNNNLNLAAVASALQTATDSRLLASPNVTVVNNNIATIQAVEEVPFQQLTQTGAGGNIGTTAFREAGVTLQVTPKIALDGTIEMDVKPEFSRLTGFTPGDNQPIIDRRTAETRVRVANGQTFVIAGLRQRSDVGDFKGIPLLTDVRFFGHLFRARETDIRESELVVFLSPTIVGYEGHMSPRDRATADTIDCRLANIPQAEGCPTDCCGVGCSSCGAGACQAGDGGVPTVAEGQPAAAESILPLADAANTADPPSVASPAESRPRDQAEANAAAAGADSDGGVATQQHDGLRYPRISSRPQPRRLPPVAGRSAAGDRGVAPAAGSTLAEVAAPATGAGPGEARVAGRVLRPDYGTRFRASGGVYPGQQREATPPGAAPSAETPQAKDASTPPAKRGFWRRFFR